MKNVDPDERASEIPMDVNNVQVQNDVNQEWSIVYKVLLKSKLYRIICSSLRLLVCYTNS
jgi:hypothetical protein